jgi:hypothetical protein
VRVDLSGLPGITFAEPKKLILSQQQGAGFASHYKISQHALASTKNGCAKTTHPFSGLKHVDHVKYNL